ncbi:MAG TPA: cellulase family glycosylhydrolase [Polyangia bacterium]|jgi:endoglycosylceramidase|nr:cellulase family glycosylhydrolase [Polyangia bacterium]
MRWLGFALALVSTPAFAAGALTVDGRFFRDQTGGVVIMRGADVGGNSKVPPFKAIDPVTQLDPLPTWGMNVIRLLFNWEAYETVKGTYDDAGYLAYYKSVVEAAGARGLYVVVDFHQDAFSRWALQGCGEGFPEWALSTTVTPATPDNGADCANWGQRQIGDAGINTNWADFYSDANGVRTAYLAMIARVATALSSETAVIGYDLLNEPLGDEVKDIAPLYNDAVAAIRGADPAAIIFVSPNGVTSAGEATKLPQPTFTNYCYSPHFYDPTVSLLQSWGGSDESIGFGAMIGTSTAWGVPLFLGEYGSQPSVDEVDGYMTAMYTQLNAALASGAQWAYTPGWTPTAKDGWDVEDFSIVDNTGALRANFRSRPFARRIAGTPLTLSVSDEMDAKDNGLQLSWTNDPTAGATELYVPAAYFGGTVSVDGDGDVKCKLAGDLATCTAKSAGTKNVRAVAAPKKRCGLTGAEALAFVLLFRRRRKRQQ